MPDEYDAIRKRLTRYERGLYFELGRARERGETRDNGWVPQFEIKTSEGTRILDSARTDGRGTEGVERKSGRVNERDTYFQLFKERAALESGQLTRSRWETVVGEKIPDKVRRQLEGLARDFPGRFHHEVVSRADALRAIQLGRSLASKQLELIRPYELDRADRARKRLDKIRETVRVRDTAIERDSPTRETAQRQTRELAESADHALTIERADAAAREQREAAEQTRARKAAEAAARRQQQEAAQRVAEAARKDREAARNGNNPPMTGREAADILIVNRPTPGLPPPLREPPSPRRSARGRDARERDRGVERER
ncbi:hypothetical protein ABZV91_25455 [Nocardia sp. NPDC004568]|uniref:hypothetical protein n=1 Tax=Nocardia sp. NPDC004568 TaxID=3154551 RepID=UPI0033A96849